MHVQGGMAIDCCHVLIGPEEQGLTLGAQHAFGIVGTGLLALIPPIFNPGFLVSCT